MCLAVIAWQSHPDYPLVVAANRDEFYTRSTRPAAWWGQNVSLLAGRDEEAGGAWFGINRHGRFALITNVRAPAERNPHAPSRGAVVVAGLQSVEPLGSWLVDLAPRAQVFNGFNLLVGDAVARAGTRTPAGGELHYYSNRLQRANSKLQPGLYGLSNGFLDSPWPKVMRSISRFACLIAQRVDVESLMALMADREVARDNQLPTTGVPIEWERALSSIQIRANGYGTRSTTVLTVRADGVATFVERTFDAAAPGLFTDRCFEFTIGAGQRLSSGLPGPREK